MLKLHLVTNIWLDIAGELQNAGLGGERSEAWVIEGNPKGVWKKGWRKTEEKTKMVSSFIKQATKRDPDTWGLSQAVEGFCLRLHLCCYDKTNIYVGERCLIFGSAETVEGCCLLAWFSWLSVCFPIQPRGGTTHSGLCTPTSTINPKTASQAVNLMETFSRLRFPLPRWL